MKDVVLMSVGAGEEDLGEKERMRWEEKRWYVVGRRRVHQFGASGCCDAQ